MPSRRDAAPKPGRPHDVRFRPAVDSETPALGERPPPPDITPQLKALARLLAREAVDKQYTGK